jgi:DNA-binding HxlR family transcriptional regulator
LRVAFSNSTSMVLHVPHTRHGGGARTGALHRTRPGISKKMLTQTLREMETSGFITRRTTPTLPPQVDYTLTPLGERFIAPIELLYDWGRRNADALDALTPRQTSRRR